MLVGMVDVIFADIAQPDQARIVGLVSHLALNSWVFAKSDLERPPVPQGRRWCSRQYQSELY